MQWTMSKKLCEAPMKRSIRGKRQMHPRWSAYLRQNMVNPKLCEDESVIEASNYSSISKWRYGIQAEGNPQVLLMRIKSSLPTCKCLWLSEYKLCTSVEGARSEKTGDQIHKDSCPELGCNGDLSSVETVYPVNVGTLCSGHKTGLAAVEVGHRGRSSRSSRRYGKHVTWRRTTANRQVPKEIGLEVGWESKSFPSGRDMSS